MALKICLLFCIYFCCVFTTIQACDVLSKRSKALSTQVNHHIYKGNFSEAQSAVLRFLEEDSLNLQEQFYGHFLLADVVKTAGHPYRCIQLLENAAQYIQELPEEERHIYQALLLGNIAESYFNAQNYDSAYVYASRSIEAHSENPLRSNSHAINNLIIGSYYKDQKDYETAITYYLSSVESYRSTSSPCELPLSYMKIGHLKMFQGHYKNAEEYLHLSLALSDSCDINQYRMLSHEALMRFYKYTHQYKKAVEQQAIKDSIANILYQKEQQEMVNALQIGYQTAITKAENQRLRQAALMEQQKASMNIILLIGCITILFICLVFGLVMTYFRRSKHLALKEQLEEIQRQKLERDALLKEVHHRVKNNLQVITSLLHLQASQPQPVLVDGEAPYNPFKSSQDRINALAIVHELLYQSDNLATIPLRQYIEELSQSLLRANPSLSPIRLRLDVPDIQVNLDTATPLGLLFNEIINNSLTHGFSATTTEGEIYVKAEPLNAQEYLFYIGDNGRGCKEQERLGKHPTLGYSLMRKLTRQLQGSIEQIHNQQKGCHYKLTLRLA